MLKKKENEKQKEDSLCAYTLFPADGKKKRKRETLFLLHCSISSEKYIRFVYVSHERYQFLSVSSKELVYPYTTKRIHKFFRDGK